MTRRKVFRSAVSAILAAAALAAGGTAGAGEWSFEVQPLYMEIHGHDQHVLTVHRAGGGLDEKSAVALDTDSALQYRGELRWAREKWTWGLDFLWVRADQEAAVPTAASSAGEVVTFEVADRVFTSAGPGETLFYRVLEDTTVESWTLDLYGLRTLAETPDGALRLQLGIRNADFDNDYRAVVGIDGVAGRRLDSSSNYDRMIGPLVGLAGEVRFGRSVLEGYLGQSVVFGSVELTGSGREFTGPFSDSETDPPAFFAQELLRNTQDAAIPITETRIGWAYEFGEHLTVGAGVQASAWWEVPVPPGVVPGPGGDQLLHETTIVFFGVLGTVKYTF